MSLALQAGGYPDLEFMLRVNQLMIDFVTDSSRTEYVHTQVLVHDNDTILYAAGKESRRFSDRHT